MVINKKMNIPNCINKTQTCLSWFQTFHHTLCAFSIPVVEFTAQTDPDIYDFPNVECARIEMRIWYILERSLLFVLPKLLLSPRVIGPIAFIPVALHTPTMIMITFVAHATLNVLRRRFLCLEDCHIRQFITSNIARTNIIDTITDVAVVCLYLYDVLSTPCLLNTVSFGIIFYNSSTVHALYQRVVENL